MEILAHARRALASADDEPARLLVVDDAQRLDAASATLVHQVVTEGVCRLVATVRSGEAAPDAIESLWTAGWAGRVELRGLSVIETGELLEAALQGPVDGATRQRLWETTRGNALYLRELVLGATATGSLRNDGGIWRLRGPTSTPPRLVELIAARLGALDDDARSAVDVLAVAERIELDQLAALVAADVLERLEDAGVIDVVDDGGRPVGRPRSPAVRRGRDGHDAVPAAAAGVRAGRRRGRSGGDGPSRRPRPRRDMATGCWTIRRLRAAHDGGPPGIQRPRPRSGRAPRQHCPVGGWWRRGRARPRRDGDAGRPPRRGSHAVG